VVTPRIEKLPKLAGMSMRAMMSGMLKCVCLKLRS